MSPVNLISILFLLIRNGGTSDDNLDSNGKDHLEEIYGKIIHASIIFRHGDRSIIRPYPTDPNPPSVWPYGFGQLTKIGKEQEYELGTWLRQRYEDSLINEHYRYDYVLVNSSDYDRTLMSAECVMAAVFPPRLDEMWSQKNLTWQPIPVHTRPRDTDNVIALDAPCERVQLEKALINQSPELQAYYLEHKNLFEYASLHSGLRMELNDPLNAIVNLSDLHDTLFIEELHNLTLPAWTHKIYPEPIRSVAAMRFRLDAFTQELQRLNAGPLLKSVISDMRQKVRSQHNQTLHFYSGHDTTLACLLTTLGVFNSKPPPYSSSVLIELRQKNEDYFVTVLYKNSTTEAPRLLQIPGCSGHCTLRDFESVAARFIPADWQKECEVSIYETLVHFYKVTLLVIMCILSLIGGIIICLRWRTTQNRQYRQYERVMKDVLEPSVN